jgi:hypothetical protein
MAHFTAETHRESKVPAYLHAVPKSPFDVLHVSTACLISAVMLLQASAEPARSQVRPLSGMKLVLSDAMCDGGKLKFKATATIEPNWLPAGPWAKIPGAPMWRPRRRRMTLATHDS